MTERYGGESRAAKKSTDNVATETGRTPERAETWTPEQLEQRHRIATLAVQMDIAMHGTHEDRAYFEQALHDAPISEKLKRTFHNVAIGYITMCANAKDAEARLRGDTVNEEEFGARLFQFRTLANPKGTVTAKRREGYFIVTCDTPDDYAKFLHPDSLNIKESAGAYHRSLPLNAGLGLPPVDVVVINGTQDAAELHRTIEHERQHWVNDNVLSAFGWSERGGKTTELHTNPKDEVLAYLRDGSLGLNMENALLTSDHYSELFKVDAESRRATVREIGDIVDTQRDLFPPEARAILVAQLYDVPFAEIPGACRTFARYYDERRETLLHATGIDFDELTSMHHAVSEVYARQVSPLQQPVRAAYRTFEQQYKNAMYDVLGAHGKFVPRDQLSDCSVPLQEAARQLKDAYERFTQAIEGQQPAPLPTVKTEWGIDTAHERSALRLAQEMIDIACTIPQTDIDRAFNEAAQHHVSHRMDALGKRFATMLATHTGMSYPSVVTLAFSTPQHILELHITQGETDRLPEMSFHLTLHASRSETARVAA